MNVFWNGYICKSKSVCTFSISGTCSSKLDGRKMLSSSILFNFRQSLDSAFMYFCFLDYIENWWLKIQTSLGIPWTSKWISYYKQTTFFVYAIQRSRLCYWRHLDTPRHYLMLQRLHQVFTLQRQHSFVFICIWLNINEYKMDLRMD